MISYKEFSKILKQIRERKEISQKEMAKRLGINKIRYNRIENGLLEPSFIELQLIIIEFEININDYIKEKMPIIGHFD
ncbi:MAG: helix-turn-helix transcriptional regulator [Acholeplasmatales bacterium]|nr:helix-turn-helix transcriptional regulator [Acholeplasmatales bacterium]